MLQSTQLVGVNDDHICYKNTDVPIHHLLVKPYADLVREARIEGFELRAASGYRSFERQCLIWNAKLSGQRDVLDDSGAPMSLADLTDKQRVFAVLRWSALPGASRHHWGSEIDIYDASALAAGQSLQLTVAETERTGPFFPMYQWLAAYLSKPACPFYRPYAKDLGGVAPEPWHLSLRSISNECERKLTIEVLRVLIERSEIALKAVVLENLEEIYRRFVINICD